MFAAFTLLLLLYISLLIIRFATMVLVHTGMSEECASLQAHSAFSGCGFTTSESERMMMHPVRRKVLIFLMMFGNIGIVSILTTAVIGIFKHFEAQESLWVKVVILAPGLCVLWYLSKSRLFKRFLAFIFNRVFYGHRNKVRGINRLSYLAHFPDGCKVAEMYVDAGSKLLGSSINEDHRLDGNIMVLGVNDIDGKYYSGKFPDGIKIKDAMVLVLYGPSEEIENLCEIPDPGQALDKGIEKKPKNGEKP